MVAREDVRAARRDVAVFARLVGQPLVDWQADALRLRTRQTVVVAPRQTGKSRSLSLLAAWWAFRTPGQVVLVVSAGEEAAKRLLATVRAVVAHPLLTGSVVDESASLVTLSNGSTIRSVPASARQIRGWSVDLLIVDEAAFVDDDLLLSAALPTTAARPDARVVLVSSPWSDDGAFFRLAQAGLDPADEITRTFRWRLADAHWISQQQVEAARASMSPLRFAAEYEGEFTGAQDALFPRPLLMANVAPYTATDGGSVLLGLDWGRAFDTHAVVGVGLLEDWGRNREPVLFLPVVETSRRLYADQVSGVAGLADRFDLLTVFSETNGVGAAPTELLAERLRSRVRVEPVVSSMRSKEEAYGRVVVLLTRNRLVLPEHPELLRQLAGVVARPTPSGGLTIAAASPSVHDDLPDALTLAVSGLRGRLPSREELLGSRVGEVPALSIDLHWLSTPEGVSVPAAASAVSGGGFSRFGSLAGFFRQLQAERPKSMVAQGFWGHM